MANCWCKLIELQETLIDHVLVPNIWLISHGARSWADVSQSDREEWSTWIELQFWRFKFCIAFSKTNFASITRDIWRIFVFWYDIFWNHNIFCYRHSFICWLPISDFYGSFLLFILCWLLRKLEYWLYIANFS